MLVNATSLGLRGEDLPAQLGLDGLEPELVADVVYGGEPTALCRWAERRGARVVDGLEMLLRQGARSLERWTGARRPSMSCGALFGAKPTRAAADIRAMAISRPVLLAVLGAVLFGATALAVQNARDTTSSNAAPAAIKADATPAPAPSSTSAPADTLKSAFDLSDVKSGRFAAKLLDVPRPLGRQQHRRLRLGASDCSGDAKVPNFDVTARLGAGKHSLSGRFVSVDGKAYFVRGNTGWRVPGEVWQPVSQGKLKVAVHPATWVRDVKSEGTESVGGVQTEHLSASVDPQAILNDVGQIAGGGAKSAAKPVAPKKATFDVWVGKDDHVLRRLTAEFVLPGRARFDLEVRLSDINKPQQIKAPAHVRAGVPSGSAGLFADSLVRTINGATGTKTASLEALTSPNPGAHRARRARPQEGRDPVHQPARLDDRAMGPVIRDVDRRTKALVLTDPVDAVDRYGKLVQDLGVSETPSIVIIDSSGKARLIEGYVDSDTLTQAVADAL